MAAMDDDVSIALYSKSLANFGAAYAATQESMKAQATNMAVMQGQLTNIQQFCMAVGQQPPPNIYTPAQQQHTFNNRRDRCNGRGHGNDGAGGGNGGGSFPQQPAWFGSNGASAQQSTHPPTPYKCWENWNYTAILMVVTLMTPTQAHHAGIRAQHTTQMQPAPTSWVD